MTSDSFSEQSLQDETRQSCHPHTIRSPCTFRPIHLSCKLSDCLSPMSCYNPRTLKLMRWAILHPGKPAKRQPFQEPPLSGPHTGVVLLSMIINLETTPLALDQGLVLRITFNGLSATLRPGSHAILQVQYWRAPKNGQARISPIFKNGLRWSFSR